MGWMMKVGWLLLSKNLLGPAGNAIWSGFSMKTLTGQIAKTQKF
jgi:hypothetical protein